MKRRPMILEEMTMGEFEQGLNLSKTVLIPFGSVEEHGYHLPLSTDTIQAYEVAKKAACLIPLFVAPPIHYGSCRSTSCHPGTISITTTTLKGLLKDIVRSCYKHGLLNFIILSGHAGGSHRMALQDAGEELITEIEEIKVAILSELDLTREAAVGIVVTTNDQHAGEIETSRIMHTHPHLVKGEGKLETPNFPGGILVRNKRKYWPDGVWGDPAKASAEKGKRLEDAVVGKIVEMVRKMDGFTE